MTQIKTETPSLQIIGLGNYGYTLAALTTETERLNRTVQIGDAGIHEDTRHNLGLATVRNLAGRLGAPPLAVEPWTVRQGTDMKRWETDEMWVASTQAEVKAGQDQTLNITLVYPGRGINASLEELIPWLEKKGIEPSRMLLVTDDARLPVGETRLSLSGPAEHNGAWPISGQAYCGLLPVFGIGVDQPNKTEEWYKQPWDFNYPVVERASDEILAVINNLAQHRFKFPIDRQRASNDALNKSGDRTYSFWEKLTPNDISALQLTSEQVARPLIGAPLFLPKSILEQKIHAYSRKLTKLAKILLEEYKAGDEDVRHLLESSAGPVDQLILEFYHHLQYEQDSHAVSLGADTAWDFMITDQGELFLTEGDRNGGDRADVIKIAETIMNISREELGTAVREQREANLNKAVTKEYLEHCKRLGLTPKEKPSIAFLVPATFVDQKGLYERKDMLDSKNLAAIFSENFDAQLITEDDLIVREGGIFFTTVEGRQVELDILWQVTSPNTFKMKNYGSLIESFLKRSN